MQGIVVGRSATLTKTFSFTPTGTPAVAVTRSDGSAVTTGSVSGAGTGWTYTIPASSNTLLDTLTETWTASASGESQLFVDTIEVAGGTLFTVSDARTVPGLSVQNNDTSYKISDARIIAARTEVERALEQELCFAMVPRYQAETLDGDGGRTFMLSRPHIRLIRSVTVNGSPLAPSQIALISASITGSLYYPGGWASGHQNVTVGYEHGLQVPPPRAKDVALALAKRALTGAPADDRATTMSTDEQTTTFYVPGASEPFDVPAANRFVQSLSLRTGIA